MSIPAWQVMTWQPARVRVAAWRDLASRLRHLGTSGHVDMADGRRHGQSVWGVDLGRGEAIGLAWDWREVRANVIALSDPMTIVSNVTLVGSDDLEVSAGDRLLLLNNAVHALRWQAMSKATQEGWDARIAA